MELNFRICFAAIYIFFSLIRFFFYSRNSRSGSKFSVSKEGKENEGKVSIIIRLLTVPLLNAIVIVYTIFPHWINKMSIDLPAGLRVSGVGLGLFCLPFLIIVHVSLGKNFSPHLQVMPGQYLVRTGIYKYIRHPMYTGFILLSLSLSLTSSNLLVTMIWFLPVLVNLMRVEKEEAMMIHQYKNEYIEYINQTGCFFPKIRPFQQ